MLVQWLNDTAGFKIFVLIGSILMYECLAKMQLSNGGSLRRQGGINVMWMVPSMQTLAREHRGLSFGARLGSF